MSATPKFSRSAAVGRALNIIGHRSDEECACTDDETVGMAYDVKTLVTRLEELSETVKKIAHGDLCHSVNGTVKCFCGKSEFIARMDEEK